VADHRLRQAFELAKLSPGQFLDALLPSMFSGSTPPDVVEDFRTTMLHFHPAGFRAMTRASAENLRDVACTRRRADPARLRRQGRAGRRDFLRGTRV
jgi:hypothetical protein